MSQPFSRRRLRFFLALVLPVLVLRALVPAGYMPADHGGLGSGLVLQLCAAQGLKSVVVEADEGGAAGSSGATAELPCAFALGSAAGPLPAAFLSASLIPVLQPAAFTAPLPAPFAAPAPRAQSPRGPPALV